MKFLFLLSLLPSMGFSQEIFLLNTDKDVSLNITHPQGLSFSYAFSNTASPYHSSCDGSDGVDNCTFNFDIKGDYTLTTTATDELGLSSSNDIEIKVADYICEDIVHYAQVESPGVSESQGPFHSTSNSPYYQWFVNTDTHSSIVWNSNTTNQDALCTTSKSATSVTCNGWTYRKGVLQGGIGKISTHSISRDRNIPSSCGTPTQTNKTVCYPADATISFVTGTNALDVNSGHTSCSNDYIVTTGVRRANISASDTSSWSDANTNMSTSTFPVGTMVIDASSENIGENLGDL